MTVELIPLVGIPEVAEGDDLAGLLLAAAGDAGPRHGDVVAVTQKVVSKAEGRVVSGDRRTWVAEETRRVVARRGDLVISETRHGFVCANAGVDSSNVPTGLVSLLPEDPDASAERIRGEISERAGVDVAVVITDTFGRPWRRGLVNVAIGCAGMASLVDLRGTPDATGRVLEATVVALADEVAAASGLVAGKASSVPATIVRGLDRLGPSSGARAIVRPRDEDLFPTSPLEAIASRRTIRRFDPRPVPRHALLAALEAALTAPVPHGSRHRSRPWVWVFLESVEARRRYLDAMSAAWVRDLRADGASDEVIARRLRSSEALLGRAPVLAVPHLTLRHADDYPDDRRRQAERDMFMLASGAAVQSFMLAVHAQGLGSAWVSSSLFCQPEAREAVDMETEWLPLGTVAVGHPGGEPPGERPPIDPRAHLRSQ